MGLGARLERCRAQSALRSTIGIRGCAGCPVLLQVCLNLFDVAGSRHGDIRMPQDPLDHFVLHSEGA